MLIEDTWADFDPEQLDKATDELRKQLKRLGFEEVDEKVFEYRGEGESRHYLIQVEGIRAFESRSGVPVIRVELRIYEINKVSGERVESRELVKQVHRFDAYKLLLKRVMRPVKFWVKKFERGRADSVAEDYYQELAKSRKEAWQKLAAEAWRKGKPIGVNKRMITRSEFDRLLKGVRRTFGPEATPTMRTVDKGALKRSKHMEGSPYRLFTDPDTQGSPVIAQRVKASVREVYLQDADSVSLVLEHTDPEAPASTFELLQLSVTEATQVQSIIEANTHVSFTALTELLRSHNVHFKGRH